MTYTDVAAAVIADYRARNQSTALSEDTLRRPIYDLTAIFYVIGYIQKATKH
jgi:hypothetical protein